MPKVAYENTRFAIWKFNCSCCMGQLALHLMKRIQELTNFQVWNCYSNTYIGFLVCLDTIAAQAAKYFPNVGNHRITMIERKMHQWNAIKTASRLISEKREKNPARCSKMKKGLMPGARGQILKGCASFGSIAGLVAHQEVIFGSQGEGLTTPSWFLLIVFPSWQE